MSIRLEAVNDYFLDIHAYCYFIPTLPAAATTVKALVVAMVTCLWLRVAYAMCWLHPNKRDKQAEGSLNLFSLSRGREAIG